VDWRERVAIVTGASSGIGRATALAFARKGCAVVAVARRESLLAEVAQACRAFAPRSEHLAGSLAERAFAEHVVEATVKRHGRLDVLVNNAAIPVRKVLYRLSVEEVEEALRTNFLSCVWTTWAAIPPMLRQGGGTIVNVSSFASKVVPTHETVYAATKCALNGLSEGLWNDLHGSGIHVTLVHPGPIDTEIWDKGQHRTGYSGRRYPPEQVADAILDAVEKRRHEVVVPRRNPKLGLARLLRLVAPGLVRSGVRRMDPVPAEALERARERARRGLPLGDD
jgi:short-subunit dehydrogenase